MMKLVNKIIKVLVVNAALVIWCVGILSLNSAWSGDGNPDPGAVIAVVLSIAIAWQYIVETI
jgi:hypothetical protein